MCPKRAGVQAAYRTFRMSWLAIVRTICCSGCDERVRYGPASGFGDPSALAVSWPIAGDQPCRVRVLYAVKVQVRILLPCCAFWYQRERPDAPFVCCV